MPAPGAAQPAAPLPDPPRTALVTGAARGIGRAVAARLAAEGLQVVVNDVDADELARAATELGAYAVPGDASSAEGAAHLVAEATAHLGRIDLAVANAGIGTGLGLDADDAAWQRALDVNTLAHVRLARLLVPGWTGTGGGRFVVVASAAGLLTMLGDAPYSVSKHAAVAFAQWLSATYRHRGVVVQAVCPQGVTTRLADAAGPLRPLLGRDGFLEPHDVADAVWRALDGDRFLVLPHPEVAGYAVALASDPDTWLARMNLLQQRLEAASLSASPEGDPA